MRNKRIRIALLEHGLTQYDLSKIMGISEMTMYRRLRDELSEEEQDRIVNMIEHSQGEHARTEQTGGVHNEK